MFKTFQSTEEGLDDFTNYKEREENVSSSAAGEFGQVRIFTLISDFEDDVLGLHVSAKRGQKIVVKKVGNYHDEDSLAMLLTRDADDPDFQNAQELYDWIKTVPDDDVVKPKFEVNDYDSLLKYYEYMAGYTSDQNPLRLENKMRKEAELQQLCASFSPRVAPYVYGLNEVESDNNNNKTHFIAMECMEKSLTDLFDTRTPQEGRVSEEFYCQLVALCFKLFQHGISHNDMHLGNIMVNSIGRPYFIDFGLSKDDMNPYQTFRNLFKTNLCEEGTLLRDVYDWAKKATDEKRVAVKVDGLYVLDDDFPFFVKLQTGLELLKKNDFPVSFVPVFQPVFESEKEPVSGNIFSRLFGY